MRIYARVAWLHLRIARRISSSNSSLLVKKFMIFFRKGTLYFLILRDLNSAIGGRNLFVDGPNVCCSRNTATLILPLLVSVLIWAHISAKKDVMPINPLLWARVHSMSRRIYADCFWHKARDAILPFSSICYCYIVYSQSVFCYRAKIWF